LALPLFGHDSRIPGVHGKTIAARQSDFREAGVILLVDQT